MKKIFLVVAVIYAIAAFATAGKHPNTKTSLRID
jgi:hypothetical protein